MQDDFTQISNSIVQCRKCPRLVTWREAVASQKVRRFRSEDYWGKPVPAFGSIDAELLLVGLAPAAHGANRTGRMFTGDRSGEWLYEALHRFGFANQSESISRTDGLQLYRTFVTAAARCPPPANKPFREELDACRSYLRREIALLDSLAVVIAFGRIAFRAFLLAWQELGRSESVAVQNFAHDAAWELSHGVTLIASYHPSQQNTQTGRLTRPMFHRVFRRARRILLEKRPGRS